MTGIRGSTQHPDVSPEASALSLPSALFFFAAKKELLRFHRDQGVGGARALGWGAPGGLEEAPSLLIRAWFREWAQKVTVVGSVQAGPGPVLTSGARLGVHWPVLTSGAAPGCDPLARDGCMPRARGTPTQWPRPPGAARGGPARTPHPAPRSATEGGGGGGCRCGLTRRPTAAPALLRSRESEGHGW